MTADSIIIKMCMLDMNPSVLAHLIANKNTDFRSVFLLAYGAGAKTKLTLDTVKFIKGQHINKVLIHI